MPLPLWVRIGEKLHARPQKNISEITEKTTSEDISSGGCFFYISQKPEVGAPAVIEIGVPWFSGLEKSTICCQGEVVRVEDSNDGKVGVACRIESYEFKSKPGTKQVNASKKGQTELEKVKRS